MRHLRLNYNIHTIIKIDIFFTKKISHQDMTYLYNKIRIAISGQILRRELKEEICD